ncbi:hypothetical protein D7I47_08980 [Protaetiibacter intestinalis]|uniref:RNA polymerase subunit sigma-70 n=2 Tax=Protaetiibacter intestinalis TaxID=2419774 RepID=A0A387BC18_9MICO|nr:hypothetical protein D7I47_08980 [Protaetiibacter intestinalis]
MVRRLRLAAESRDVGRLQELLAPNVAVVIESAEAGAVAPRVVMGRGGAASALVHGLGSHRGRRVVARSVNGQAGLLLSDDGRPSALVCVDFVGRLISVVWVRLHPELLRHGNRV